MRVPSWNVKSQHAKKTTDKKEKERNPQAWHDCREVSIMIIKKSIKYKKFALKKKSV
jgi:hypothetical protein